MWIPLVAGCRIPLPCRKQQNYFLMEGRRRKSNLKASQYFHGFHVILIFLDGKKMNEIHAWGTPNHPSHWSDRLLGPSVNSGEEEQRSGRTRSSHAMNQFPLAPLKVSFVILELTKNKKKFSPRVTEKQKKFGDSSEDVCRRRGKKIRTSKTAVR